MAKVKITGHASGTGILTVTAPNTSTDRTITLPDATCTLADNSDVTRMEDNIALLGFYRASDNSVSKYNLVDQVIDEYEDATGVDAGNSTNEALVSGSYSGNLSPTQDADATAADGGDTWYKWTDTGATGSFTPAANGSYDFLVIAGGGSGSFGGGGAGGFRTSYGSGDISGGDSAVESNLSLVAGTAYTITVGAGRSPSDTGSRADTGDDSSIAGSDITNVVSLGGGMGGGSAGNNLPNTNGTAGGSGGGAGYDGSAGTGGAAGTAGQGFRGAHNGSSGEAGGGGGGGAGSLPVGEGEASVAGGGGGAGQASSITGAAVTYAGGGGGAYNGAAGTGGAGAGKNDSYSTWTALQPSGGTASPNTGSGGGGCNGGEAADYGGSGGSGIVILRSTTAGYSDLTLQSVATTAESAPTTGDIVILIEDGAGTATINTDIKAYISRDGSAFSSEVVLLDEGDWGTNKRIFAAHNVDLSGITSGTSMKYKITTHNQSGSKFTKIHATSLAWA